MMDEQVIRIIATRGPSVPAQIAKETGSNTMIAGAVLSKLASERKIFISNTKFGGSPVYYLKEQAPKLQDLYKYLNEKDKKTYELLRSRRIIRDRGEEALTRVSLRNIKDFAIPLEVTLGDQREIFWKWYLTGDAEATELIREFLKNTRELTEPRKEIAHEEKPATENEKLTSFVWEDRKAVSVIEKAAEKQEKTDKKEEKILPKKEKQEEIKKTEIEIPSDSFAEKIIKFLKDKGIAIKNIEVKKKNSEIEMILNIPSVVGNIEYYCRAKNKPKINDADLSSAYVQGQAKNLPSMLITSGELTKKASQMLEKEIRMNILKI